MKKMILLSFLCCLPAFAQIDCTKITSEEVHELYCKLQSGPNFKANLDGLKSYCAHESAIYKRVAAELEQKAERLNNMGGDGLNLKLLSTHYSLTANRALQIKSSIAMLELRDSMSSFSGTASCH